MKVWTDKEGKKLTASEFKERFKQGLQKITPLQQAKTNQRAYYIMLIGILAGVVTSWINSTWWLVIILGAATITQLITILGNWQKIQTLKLFEIKPEEKPVEDKSYIQ